MSIAGLIRFRCVNCGWLRHIKNDTAEMRVCKHCGGVMKRIARYWERHAERASQENALCQKSE